MNVDPPPATHSARAQSMLRERILSGKLTPGTRLLEVTTAGDLGISRTPVREAMMRLAEEGLLERARGGYVVAAFSPEDAADAIELRGILEGTAARLAAELGCEASDLDAMRATVARLDEVFSGGPDAVDLDAYASLNARFHEQLHALPGRPLIRREARRAARLPFASPSAFLSDTGREIHFRRTLPAAQEQHRAIVEAIAAREGARAEALAREHSRAALSNLRDILEAGVAERPAMPALALIVG